MPRLIRPTVETEQPAPLTEEQHAQLNRIFGPASQGQVHTLPEDFEEKRQAELEKMGLDNGQPPADSWKPDSRVTEMLGLKGETAAELAEELQNPPTVADTSRTGAGLMADEEEPDINAQLEEFFKDEKEIPLVPEERDPHLVPLEEQTTEEEEREVPQSLLQQVSRQIIEGRPWSNWLDPQTATAPLHHFNLTADRDSLALVLQPDNQLAAVTVEALAALGKRCAFPPEFVGKLPAELAAEVVNDRISAADNHEMTVLLQDGKWTAILPAWRGICPYRVICDTAYDTLARHYTEIEIDRLETNGSLHLRLLTPVIYPVSIDGGNLQMGIDLTFSYNTTMTVSLLVRRQDGAEMTAYPQSFSWRARTGDAGSAERQLEWLQNAVMYTIGMYMGFVEKAKELNEYNLGTAIADYIHALAEKLGIPKKHHSSISSEYSGNPMLTGWENICTVARFALNYADSVELQAALGDYVANWGN